MFNRQFSLLVMATLLLSPTLVQANEIDGDTHLSVGNMQIHKTGDGTTIQMPGMQINNPKAIENRGFISRNRRRYRAPVIRRTAPVYVPPTVHQRVDPDDEQSTTTTTTLPTRRSIIRSSTTRSSGNGSQSVNEQQQSIQCSGNGSSVSQSTSTVNGRTVSSEVRCP
jgi:hypothetical protein